MRSVTLFLLFGSLLQSSAVRLGSAPLEIPLPVGMVEMDDEMRGRRVRMEAGFESETGLVFLGGQCSQVSGLCEAYIYRENKPEKDLSHLMMTEFKIGEEGTTILRSGFVTPPLGKREAQPHEWKIPKEQFWGIWTHMWPVEETGTTTSVKSYPFRIQLSKNGDGKVTLTMFILSTHTDLNQGDSNIKAPYLLYQGVIKGLSVSNTPEGFHDILQGDEGTSLEPIFAEDKTKATLLLAAIYREEEAPPVPEEAPPVPEQAPPTSTNSSLKRKGAMKLKDNYRKIVT